MDREDRQYWSEKERAEASESQRRLDLFRCAALTGLVAHYASAHQTLEEVESVAHLSDRYAQAMLMVADACLADVRRANLMMANEGAAATIIARAIAKARAEERERCAKVAAGQAPDVSDDTPDEYRRGQKRCALDIAGMVRGLK